MSTDTHHKKNAWRKFPVHAVTDDRVVRRAGFLEAASAVASSGVAAINLRAHGLSGRRLYGLAVRLREIATENSTPLIIAGRADIAIAVGADAVQLGRHAIPLDSASSLCARYGKEFGYSCHTEQEALAAQQAGASYIYLGTVFSSASKPGIDPCGVGHLAKSCKTVDIPVVAIGGIDVASVDSVAEAGASGAAAISSIWNAPYPAEAVLELARAFGNSVIK